MKKLLLFSVIFVITAAVYAESDKFFMKIDQETVNIELNISDFQTAQLFKRKDGGIPVNIFEFSGLENRFSEKADSGNCYFIKVYKNSESPVITDEKCVPETYFVGMIESTLLIFLLLLVFSFAAPMFVPFRFLLTEVSNPEKEIYETINILAGEDSKNVLIHSSSDWKGDPVNIAVNSFLKGALKKDQENVLTTFSDGVIFTGSDIKTVMKNVPMLAGQRPFITQIQRNDLSMSAVFHITENNPESFLDSFKDRKIKRKMIFSQGLSGAVIDLLFKRKALISIESLMPGENKVSERFPDHSGAYLFLAVIASAVMLGSILKTFGIEKFIENIMVFLAGGG